MPFAGAAAAAAQVIHTHFRILINETHGKIAICLCLTKFLAK